MPRRSYTAAEKAQALALYRTDGPRPAAEATGIPSATIASWARRGNVHTECIETRKVNVEAARLKWEERRTDLAHRMGEIAAKALERVEHAIDGQTADGADLMVPGDQGRKVLIRPSDAKALATTCAILVDKAQLLTGAATSRSEHIASDSIDTAVAELEKELAVNTGTVWTPANA